MSRVMTMAEASRGWEKRVVEGKFPLQQWLGSSDHSAVFLTQRGAPDSQRAAIKLVDAGGLDLQRQLSEWRAAGQLSHPNLLQIFQIGPCLIDGAPLLYLVSEYADEDLSQILPQRALTTTEVGDMLPPLLDALSTLHKRRFVHRRIRPSNLLAVGDQLKLSSDHVCTQSECSALGRPRDEYDAPETAAGNFSAASDVWALGVTLHTALTQTTTIPRNSRGEAAPASVPEPFRGIIRECLHLDPKRRCTAADISARLQPAARSVPAEAVAPIVVPQRKSLSRGVIALAVVVVGVLVGLVAVASHSGKDAPSKPASIEQATPQPASQTPPPKPSPAPLAEAPKADARGVAIHQVLPEVPQSARNTITGKIRVVVKVDVDSAGKVTDAKLTSPGPSRYFANLALKAARGWEFSPPTSNGESKASTWAIRFRFGRARTEASPERLKR